MADFLNRIVLDLSQPRQAIASFISQIQAASGSIAPGVAGRNQVADAQVRAEQQLNQAYQQGAISARQLVTMLNELRLKMAEVARTSTTWNTGRAGGAIRSDEMARAWARAGATPLDDAAIRAAAGAEGLAARQGGTQARLRALAASQANLRSDPQLRQELAAITAAYRAIPATIRRQLGIDITELRDAQRRLSSMRRGGGGASPEAQLAGLIAARERESAIYTGIGRESALAAADARVGAGAARPNSASVISNGQAELELLRRRRLTAEGIALERALAGDTHLARVTGELAAMKQRRLASERVAMERALAGDQALTAATAEAAALRRRRNLQVQAETDRRLSDPGSVSAAADAQLAAERRRALEQQAAYQRIQGPSLVRGFGSVADELGAGRAAQQARAAQIQQSTQRALAADRSYIEATAQAAVARRQLQAAVAIRERQLLAGSQIGGGGSLFQRLQANIANRPGGTGGGRLPTEFASLGQFLSSRALTTAGFAVSGAALYGSVSFIGNVIKESTQLQQELAIVRTQFDQIANAGDGGDGSRAFEVYVEQLREISHEAGVALGVAAPLVRQLAGSFADEGTGQLNFGRGLVEGRYALRATQISNLQPQEINDDLTAVALAFDTNFERILNSTVGFSQSFGVVEDEITNFVSRLAPLGAELGFTYEQLAGLGAVAQQASGVGGSALAEQFGRILPALQSRRAELIQLLQTSPSTTGEGDALITAFSEGDTPEVLRQLISAYDDLTASQRNQLASLVGGRREAQAFYAVLDRGNATLRALDASEADFAGKFDKRWEAYTSTVDYSVDQFRVAMQQLGNAVFEAGLGDALKTLAEGGSATVQVLGNLNDIFAEANDTLGGIPGKILAVAVALRILRAAGGAAGRFTGAGVGAGAAGGAGGFLAGLVAPGAFLSPYRAPTPGAVPPAASGLIDPRTGQPFPPPPPASNLRPGAPAGLAARGTAGALTAGLMANVPGLLATAAIGFAISEVARVNAEIEGIRDKVDQQAAALFEEGVSRARVRERLENIPAPSSSLRDRAASQIGGLFNFELDSYINLAAMSNPITAVGYAIPNIFGKDKKREEWQDAIDSAVRQNEGEELLENFSQAQDSELNALARALLEADEEVGKMLGDRAIDMIGDQERLAQARESLDLDPDATLGEARDAIQAAIDNVVANPTDETAVETLNDLMAGFDQETRERIEEAVGEMARREEAEARVGTGQQSVDLIKARVAAGELGPSALIEALRSQIELQEQLVAAFPDDVSYRQALTELQSELANTRTQPLLDSLDFAFQVGDITGGLDPAARVELARTTLAQLQAAGAPLEQQMEAALQLAQLNRQAVIDAMNKSGDPAEIARLAEGLALPPEAKEVMIRSQLISGAASLVIDVLRGDDDEGVFTEMVNDWAEAMAATGRIPDVLIWKLTERKNWLEQILMGATYFAGGEELAAARDELDRINDFLNNGIPGLADGLGAPPGDGETAGPSDEEIAATRQAIQTQGELAKARAGNDRVAGAREDLNTAQRLLDAARPGLEKDQALANYLNAKRSYDDAVRDEARRIADSVRAVARARAAGDPIALATIDIAAAQDALNNATTTDESNLALAQMINARRALQDAILAREQARIQMLIAQAGDDPVTVAGYQIQLAQMALANAQAGSAEWYQAAGQLAQANQAREQAIRDVEAARLEFLAAGIDNNALASAGAAVQQAQAAVAAAKVGSAEWYRAKAQLVQAQREYNNQVLDVAISQKELALAMYNAAGDTVAAAKVQLDIALARLNQLRATGAGQAEINRAQAAVVDAQAALRDAQYNDQIGEIDFALQMEKITTAEAIRQLEALLKIPNLTKEQTQQLLLKIKQLRDELGRDFALNLPDLITPTLYEARRLNQAGIPGYQSDTVIGSGVDNRVYDMSNWQIIAPPGTDVEQLATAVANRVGDIIGGPMIQTPGKAY